MSVAQATPRNIRPPSAIMRDLSAALIQQMFYWGMDAAHSGGNVFQKRGFRKSASTGLKGTSCYSLPWQGGEIFLHGACAGWFSPGNSGGFLFIRPSGRCHIWKGYDLPVPGKWPRESLASVNPSDHVSAFAPFLSWLLDHEEMIKREMGDVYRVACYRKYRSLPKSRPWLAPADGEAWLRLFLQDSTKTPPAKFFPAMRSAEKPFPHNSCKPHANYPLLSCPAFSDREKPRCSTTSSATAKGKRWPSS